MPAPPGHGHNRGFLTEEEKQNMPKVTGALIKRILSYLKPYWLQFLFVFIAILLSATIGLLPSIITGRIVDEALIGEDLQLLIRLLLMAFATLAASQIIGVLESYINAWIANRIIFDMKNQMYDHLQHMPHRFFTTEKQGDIITRMNTDISGVSNVISGTLSSVVMTVARFETTEASVPEITDETPEMSVFMRVMMSPCFSEVKKLWGMCWRWSYIWFFMSKMMRLAIHALM